jgi:hypothetical protein
MEELIALLRNSNFSEESIKELVIAKMKADADITARERVAKIKANADIRISRIKANNVHFSLYSPTVFHVYYFKRPALFF